MIKNFQIQMRPQAFDLWTSFFMAVIVLLATLVWVLFILWLFADQPVVAEVHTPARVTIVGKSGSEQPEFEVPRASEVAQLQQPDVLEQLETADLSTVIARVAAQNSNQAGFVSASDGGGIPGKDVGPDPGADVVPRFERWELNFEAKDAKSYAIQLDQMGIQLGAFGGGIKGLHYASDLSGRPAGTHSMQPSVETRLFFSWTRATPLAGYERTLLQKAGIPAEGREIVKFIPRSLENRLAAIELEYAARQGIKTVEGIAKTIFESYRDAAGWQFRVISQRYRNH